MPFTKLKKWSPQGSLLRVCMLVMAYAHTLPAKKHVLLFAMAPSGTEAWKGGGAVVAVAIYLIPPQLHARALGTIHRHMPMALRIGGLLLALAHLVPALDHVPRLLIAPSFADGWRGVGAVAAATWFVLPLQAQAALLHAVRRRSLRNPMRVPLSR